MADMAERFYSFSHTCCRHFSPRKPRHKKMLEKHLDKFFPVTEKTSLKIIFSSPAVPLDSVSLMCSLIMSLMIHVNNVSFGENIKGDKFYRNMYRMALSYGFLTYELFTNNYPSKKRVKTISPE